MECSNARRSYDDSNNATALATAVLSHEHMPAFVRSIDHLLDHHESLAARPCREPPRIT